MSVGALLITQRTVAAGFLIHLSVLVAGHAVTQPQRKHPVRIPAGGQQPHADLPVSHHQSDRASGAGAANSLRLELLVDGVTGVHRIQQDGGCAGTSCAPSRTFASTIAAATNRRWWVTTTFTSALMQHHRRDWPSCSLQLWGTHLPAKGCGWWWRHELLFDVSVCLCLCVGYVGTHQHVALQAKRHATHNKRMWCEPLDASNGHACSHM